MMRRDESTDINSSFYLIINFRYSNSWCGIPWCARMRVQTLTLILFDNYLQDIYEYRTADAASNDAHGWDINSYVIDNYFQDIYEYRTADAASNDAQGWEYRHRVRTLLTGGPMDFHI
jgi:hypothetical protein